MIEYTEELETMTKIRIRHVSSGIGSELTEFVATDEIVKGCKIIVCIYPNICN